MAAERTRKKSNDANQTIHDGSEETALKRSNPAQNDFKSSSKHTAVRDLGDTPTYGPVVARIVRIRRRPRTTDPDRGRAQVTDTSRAQNGFAKIPTYSDWNSDVSTGISVSGSNPGRRPWAACPRPDAAAFCFGRSSATCPPSVAFPSPDSERPNDLVCSGGFPRCASGELQ